MHRKKNIKSFIISTKGIFGSRKILEHVRKNIEKQEVDKADAQKIYEDVGKQIGHR